MVLFKSTALLIHRMVLAHYYDLMNKKKSLHRFRRVGYGGWWPIVCPKLKRVMGRRFLAVTLHSKIKKYTNMNKIFVHLHQVLDSNKIVNLLLCWWDLKMKY